MTYALLLTIQNNKNSNISHKVLHNDTKQQRIQKINIHKVPF